MRTASESRVRFKHYTEKLNATGQDSIVVPELAGGSTHAPEHIGVLAFAGRHRSS